MGVRRHPLNPWKRRSHTQQNAGSSEAKGWCFSSLHAAVRDTTKETDSPGAAAINLSVANPLVTTQVILLQHVPQHHRCRTPQHATAQPFAFSWATLSIELGTICIQLEPHDIQKGPINPALGWNLALSHSWVLVSIKPAGQPAY